MLCLGYFQVTQPLRPCLTVSVTVGSPCLLGGVGTKTTACSPEHSFLGFMVFKVVSCAACHLVLTMTLGDR